MRSEMSDGRTMATQHGNLRAEGLVNVREIAAVMCRCYKASSVIWFKITFGISTVTVTVLRLFALMASPGRKLLEFFEWPYLF